jgi:hypothetical protein
MDKRPNSPTKAPISQHWSGLRRVKREVPVVSQLQLKSPQLWRYWTAGKGLARWADSPTPYRTLVAELGSEGVPAGQIHGLAARIYHEVFGVWPGKHDGGKH